MKYSKKMILMDFDPSKLPAGDTKNVFEVQTNANSNMGSSDDGDKKHVSELHNLLREILENRSLNDHDKMKLYGEAFQKYIFSVKEHKSKRKQELEKFMDQLMNKMEESRQTKIRNLSASLNAKSPFLEDNVNEEEDHTLSETDERRDLEKTPPKKNVSKAKDEMLLTQKRDPVSGERIYCNLRNGKQYIKRRLSFKEYTPKQKSKTVKKDRAEAPELIVGDSFLNSSVIKLWESIPKKKRTS